MPAIDVFARSIEYLKDEFVKKFQERNLQVSITPLNENVTWILTVPAIWDEPAKQFMEEAAELVMFIYIIISYNCHYVKSFFLRKIYRDFMIGRYFKRVSPHLLRTRSCSCVL